jgi:outer membrane protein assembly factor BamB
MFRISITCVLILVVSTVVTIGGVVGAQNNPQLQNTTVHLRWGPRAGVSRYRLQLASDVHFRDIVFDSVINGTETDVNDLAPGRYFWRIAPLTKLLGEFSSAGTIEVAAPSVPRLPIAPSPAPTVTPQTLPANSIVTTGGWRAAVGDIARPLVAHLRSRDSLDVVGTNADGVTFALDSASGVALWSFRGRRPGTPGVPPVIIDSRTGSNDVLVFEGQSAIKIEGRTGRELWRSPLPAAPSSAIASSDISGPIVIIIDSSLRRLLVMNGLSGSLISQTLLPARVVGPPTAVVDQSGRLLIAYENGEVELRDKTGQVIRSGSAGSPASTGPVIVKGRRQDLVLIGTREGLTAMTAADLKPLGRVTIKDDSPRGNLIAADLDGDGVAEVIMTTQRGHLIAIHSEDGQIIWDTLVSNDSKALAFADLDGDGFLDVIVPGTQAFATAFSGRDGATIWKDSEMSDSVANHPTSFPSRGLVSVPLRSGVLLISSDVSRTGLRAIEFPKPAVRPPPRAGLQ